MSRLSIFGLVCLTISTSAVAAPVCGPWVNQNNGTYWRVCMDGGRQYCELQKRNEIRPIRCP